MPLVSKGEAISDVDLAAPDARAGAWSDGLVEFACESWCAVESGYNKNVCDAPQCLGCGCACLPSCGVYTCDLIECGGCEARGKRTWRCIKASFGSPSPPPPRRSRPPPVIHYSAPSPPPLALFVVDRQSCSLGGSAFLVAGRQVGQAEFERAHLEAPLQCAPLCQEHEGMAFAQRHFFVTLALRTWDEHAVVKVTLLGRELRLLSVVGGTLAYDSPGGFDDVLAMQTARATEGVAGGSGIEQLHDERARRTLGWKDGWRSDSLDDGADRDEDLEDEAAEEEAEGAVVALRLAEWSEELAVGSFDSRTGGYEEGFEHGGTLRLAGTGVVAAVSSVDCRDAAPPSPPPRPPPSPPPPPPDPPLNWWVHASSRDHDLLDDDIFDASAGEMVAAADDPADLSIGTRPSTSLEQIEHKWSALDPMTQLIAKLGALTLSCLFIGMCLGLLVVVFARRRPAARTAAAASTPRPARRARKVGAGGKHSRVPTREADVETLAVGEGEGEA